MESNPSPDQHTTPHPNDEQSAKHPNFGFLLRILLPPPPSPSWGRTLDLPERVRLCLVSLLEIDHGG
jgi:hypothetical protein